MNSEEIVDLPDTKTQQLVHPLDLPEARQLFRRSWLVESLTNPAVALCFAALIWFASSNYIAPLIAGAALIGFGVLASRYFSSEAWAFIPRKRQDRERPLPVTWELTASLVFAVVLSATLLLIANRLGRPDVPPEVREFTFGMGAATGVLVIGELVMKLFRYSGSERRRAWFTLPGVVAVVASVIVSHDILFGPGASWTTNLMVWGAVTMLIVGVLVGVWKVIDTRRTPIGE